MTIIILIDYKYRNIIIITENNHNLNADCNSDT